MDHDVTSQPGNEGGPVGPDDVTLPPTETPVEEDHTPPGNEPVAENEMMSQEEAAGNAEVDDSEADQEARYDGGEIPPAPEPVEGEPVPGATNPGGPPAEETSPEASSVED